MHYFSKSSQLGHYMAGLSSHLKINQKKIYLVKRLVGLDFGTGLEIG